MNIIKAQFRGKAVQIGSNDSIDESKLDLANIYAENRAMFTHIAVFGNYTDDERYRAKDWLRKMAGLNDETVNTDK